MIRIVISTLAATIALGAAAAGAQGLGYSTTAKTGYYYDQGVYVPAFPRTPRAEWLQRQPAEAGRALVPDITDRRSPEALVDRDGDGMIDFYRDENGYSPAFPK